MRIGTFVSGSFNVLSTYTYTALGSTISLNQVYEARMDTGYLSTEQQLDVLKKLQAIEGIKVLAAETSSTQTRMQFIADPVSLSLWAILINALPIIIPTITVLVIGLILASKVPEWAIAVPFVCLGVGFVAWAVYKAKK